MARWLGCLYLYVWGFPGLNNTVLFIIGFLCVALCGCGNHGFTPSLYG